MSMELFVMGIVAGIAMVYFITNHLGYIAEPTTREMEMPETPEEAPTCTMTVEQMDAWYDSVMEIFSTKE